MRIIELEIEGFRSFGQQFWYPGTLNVLIGPNAGGKSNLLRVLELVSVAAQGRLGKYVQQEGGMEPILWNGKAKSIWLRAKMSPIPPYTDETKDALTYELMLLRLGNTSAYRINHECLGNFCEVETGQMTQPYKLLERDPQHAIVFSTDSLRFEPLQTTTENPTTGTTTTTSVSPDVISEEETLLSVAVGPFSTNRFVSEFQREVASWKIHQDFQTHRDAMIRTAQVARADTQVDADGQNLISVLHTLYTNNRDFETEIDTAMRAAFGTDYEKLVFPPAADQRIQLRIRWRSLDEARSAADLSDGTLRFLFLLTVLANPNPAPLIAIDEPEAGLHPSMLPIVAEYARQASSRAQVFLTTHSPEFLDAFGNEPPTTTVVERHAGQTMLRVVSGNDLSYWLKKYTLGELYRSKELEAAP